MSDLQACPFPASERYNAVLTYPGFTCFMCRSCSSVPNYAVLLLLKRPKIIFIRNKLICDMGSKNYIEKK